MIPFWILFILAAILSALQPILIKLYINDNESKIYLIYLAAILSIFLIIIYFILIKQYGATRMYTIVKVLAILMVAIVAFLFLGEKLTIKYIIGILLGCVSLYLLVS